eukprot:UN20185
MKNRNDFVNYKFVWDHFKFLFTNFIPEYTIHSKKQDIRIGQEHYDRGNDFFNWFLEDIMIYTSGYLSQERNIKLLK